MSSMHDSMDNPCQYFKGRRNYKVDMNKKNTHVNKRQND